LATPVNPPLIQLNNFTLSSFHPGGVQIGMFDGSVRFLSEDVDFQTVRGPAPYNSTNGPVDSILERLVAIADGQPIGEF
jgi:prepilin-type processing-associated H-X9-DG protein